MPSSGNIDERVAALLAVNPNVATSIVLSQLIVGLSYCRILRSRRDYLHQYSPRNLEQARKSLLIAEKTMWKLKPTHPKFNEIMACAERLRFEIQSLSS